MKRQCKHGNGEGFCTRDQRLCSHAEPHDETRRCDQIGPCPPCRDVEEKEGKDDGNVVK